MTYWDAPNQETVRPDGSGPGIEIVTPTLTSIAPNTAIAGSVPPVVVTATGTGFDANTVLQIAGADQLTTFVDATHVSATFRPATASVGVVPVTVRNGNEPSTSQNFTYTVSAGQEVGHEGFDPAAHTVVEVEEYVTDHPDERTAILEAESAGKNRTTLIEWFASS